MQWWMNAVDYPFMISGKPLFGLPANIPIMFELTVLFSAFATFFGMWGLNGMPKLYHPLFTNERFRRATAGPLLHRRSRPAIPSSTPDETREFAGLAGRLAVEEVDERRRTERCRVPCSTSARRWWR